MNPLKKYLGKFIYFQDGIRKHFIVIHGESTFGKTPYKVFFDQDLNGHLFNKDGIITLIKNFEARKK